MVKICIFYIQGTVAYYLLLDNRFRNSNSYLGAEFQKPVEGYRGVNSNEASVSVLSPRSSGYMDYQGTHMRNQVERKWALGLQVSFLMFIVLYE